MSYTLIIKGDETAAFAACSAHKVELTSIVRHERFDECIATTLRDFDERVLQNWFCEPLNADALAPAGTLMWYGPVNTTALEVTAMRNKPMPCPCGSNLTSYWQFDARGIELCRTCPKCHDGKMAQYRPEVLTNANYETTEDIEEY